MALLNCIIYNAQLHRYSMFCIICRMSDTSLLVHRYLCVVHIINFVCSLHLIFMHIIHSHLTIHWIYAFFSIFLTSPYLSLSYQSIPCVVHPLSLLKICCYICLKWIHIFCIWYFVANYMHRIQTKLNVVKLKWFHRNPQLTGQMNSRLFGKPLYWICILFRHFLLGACT